MDANTVYVRSCIFDAPLTETNVISGPLHPPDTYYSTISFQIRTTVPIRSSVSGPFVTILVLFRPPFLRFTTGSRTNSRTWFGPSPSLQFLYCALSVVSEQSSAERILSDYPITPLRPFRWASTNVISRHQLNFTSL